MNKNILIVEGKNETLVEREELIGAFLKEIALNEVVFNNSIDYMLYILPKYADVLLNVEKIQSIQIFNDGVIRLFLIPEGHHEPKKSIFIKDRDAAETLRVLEKIINSENITKSI